MKRKILHILSRCEGGVNTVLRDIILGTVDDYEITVLIIGAYSALNIQVSEKIKIISLNKKNVFSWAVIYELFSNVGKNDIIHVHLFPTLYLCAFVHLFFPNKQFVYTEHASYNNRRSCKLLRIIEIPVYKLYDHIIAVSDSCKQNLEKWLCYKVNVQTIYNGIDIKNINVKYNFDFRSVGITSKYIITMVARLSNDKDFVTLIKGMSFLDSDYHCVLVGDGDLKEKITEDIKYYAVSDRITLLGYRIDVYEILAASTLSVLSSFAEGLGLVILESLAVSTPCLGSNVDGIKDILPKSYLFECGNSCELAELIIKVSKEELARQSYFDILERYDLKNMIEGYKKIYG